MDEGENEAQSRHINTQMCMCVRQSFGKMISKKKTLFCYSRLMEKQKKCESDIQAVNRSDIF